MDFTDSKNTRRKSAFNTYIRVCDSAGAKLNEAYDEHKNECMKKGIVPKHFIGFRSEFLAKRLKEEDAETRALVESARKDAGEDSIGNKLATLIDVQESVDEDERLSNVKKLDR